MKTKNIVIIALMFFNLISLTCLSEYSFVKDPISDIDNSRVSNIIGNKEPSENAFNLQKLFFSVKNLDDMESEFDNIYSLVKPEKVISAGLKGDNITIAIIDSGVNDNNYWINNLNASYSTNGNENDTADVIGHGTLVASIISKITPNSKLISIKVTNAQGEIKREWLENAFLLARDLNVSIIHASVGSTHLELFNSSIIEDIAARNVPIILAAGNSGPYGSSLLSPAIYPKTISVGMAYNQTYIPGVSSIGPRPSGILGPDLIAPGVNIVGFDQTGNETKNSGTSFSAPFVTGAVALLKSRFPSVSSEYLKAVLQESANFIPKISPIVQGNGLLDISAAYNVLHTFTNDIPFVSFSPKTLSSRFLYYGHCINGESRIYRLNLYTSKNLTLTSLNASSLLPIEIVSFNISENISQGFHNLDLSISIPLDLRMSKYSGNITFEFLYNNLNDYFAKNISINIENRYPGGNVIFYQGFDNDTFISDGPTGKYSLLQKMLELNYGFNIKSLIETNNWLAPFGTVKKSTSTNLTQDDLEGAHILILSDIEHTISEQEMTLIRNWVSQGHSLLIFSYPSYLNGNTEVLSNQNSINTLLEPYGISIDDDASFESDFAFKRFNQASIADEGEIFYQKDLSFWYNGTSITVNKIKGASILANATNQLSDEEVPIAAFWKDPSSNGKVVVFGSDQPFNDYGLYNHQNDGNELVISTIMNWLIYDQQIKYEILLTSSPPQIGSKTQIQLSFPNSDFTSESFNATIIEANGSLSQLNFTRKNNIYLAEWTPIAAGQAYLWTNIQVLGKAPLNAVIGITIYDATLPDMLMFFIFGGFIVIAVVYYIISSRQPKQPSMLEQQLFFEYAKKKRKDTHRGLETYKICPRCNTPRYSDESKFCYKCGKEL
ncbi:MAG: S8 family serine peptidase [Candidatus Hodarchaeales archaeon]